MDDAQKPEGAATRRPVSPGAEEILGLYFPVLDHGFVALVDYMGTDACIERAARVSYGYGTRKTSLTRGLLRYLRRHKHTTPSEMVELKFHCCMPIFVARQWIRHRTACLAGDAQLGLDLTIERLHRQWTEGVARPTLGESGDGPRLWSCHEPSGEMGHTRVTDVWKSGVKPVFDVILQDGRALKMSKDHRCLTERGWLTLQQATGFRMGEGVGAPRFGVDGVFSRGVREWARIARIEYAGERMTYDLEVAGPSHNFVANGFIVHNSVNEYSGRYSLMPMAFYTPPPEQLQTQSTTSNQGRSGEPVDEARYREAVLRWHGIRDAAEDAYAWMTSHDVARELARIDLPLSTYTQWYWKIDLHNLLHFLTLRVDPHAQWEIQEYGRIMAGVLKRVAPLSYEAWIDYDVCGARLSRMELEALREIVKTRGGAIEGREGTLTAEELSRHGLSKREVEELLGKLAPGPVPDYDLDLSQAKPAEHFAEKLAGYVPKVDPKPAE